ncbi:hypothetical protein [Bosea sp. 117]|uniref:hypothetical protein n=1 Tax=Bosea sp. 117 TaxID=1125973 RepID=UPI0020BD83CA|nr:hypothetical protein [Bosea sp. 117]
MPVLGGTPADIADRLETFLGEGDANGFTLIATYTPGCFEEFVYLVVPELQRAQSVVRTGGARRPSDTVDSIAQGGA